MTGMARRLPRELEPVEFRRVPGLAGSNQDDEVIEYWEREPAWRWLGIYPLLAFLVVYLTMIGMA